MIGGVLLPIAGLPDMVALSALVVGLPGLAGYRVGELRRDTGRPATRVGSAA